MLKFTVEDDMKECDGDDVNDMLGQFFRNLNPVQQFLALSPASQSIN